MDTNFDRGRIDRLQRKLYSRKTPGEPDDERTPIARSELEVDRTWQGESRDFSTLIQAERAHKEIAQGNVFKKILIGSVVFFCLAVGAAGYLFFGGSNSVSGNNIDIQVIGPSSVGGGENLSLDVLIQNNNNADLENTSMSVAYPDGTRSALDVTAPLTFEKQDIGPLGARAQARKTIKAVLFGEKDSVQKITITYEYTLKGSSAVFHKEKEYEIIIKSSPVIVTIENPNEVNSNQQVKFVVTIASNSSEQIQNVLLKAEYPFGFAYQSSDAAPVDKTGTLWRVGSLNVSEKKRITIIGVLQGQNEEERTFRFSTGIENPNKDDELGAVFSVLPQTIKIKKPFLAVDVTADGNSGSEIVARPGEKVQTTVSWKNNLPNKLLNTQVLVKFSGNILDKSSVSSSGGGFYRSIDNTIIYDKNNTQGFTSFDPGDIGEVSFEFAPLSYVSGGANQPIRVSVTVSGDQVFDNGKEESISTTVEKTVTLATQTNLKALVVRSLGAFENSGAMPPKVDLPTTYTVEWFATNSLNTVQKAKVTAVLPSYVVWVGLTSPGTELISYDLSSHTVSWNIGELKSGTGYSTTARTAQFQVSLTPSISQVGSAPVLLGGSRLTGLDSVTSQPISTNADQLTTKYSTDPDYRLDDENVVQ